MHARYVGLFAIIIHSAIKTLWIGHMVVTVKKGKYQENGRRFKDREKWLHMHLRIGSMVNRWQRMLMFIQTEVINYFNMLKQSRYAATFLS